MARDSTYKVGFRRRREGKTNYRKRLELVKSGRHRLVVRQSNKCVLAQLVIFDRQGDKVSAEGNSRDLEKFGWIAGKKNLPAAYLAGFLAGTRAKKAGIESAVLDMGFRTPVHGARCFAALKGAIDSGLKIPFEAGALPAQERLSGKHIEDYAKKLSPEEFKKKFSGYASRNVDARNLTALFESAKKNILQEVK
ncbi:MAG: 50S ribosomal protein L18 [Candidatus ainarchaeum sp.]|nr:50S ribosomal protein L18 [Candidatus ainarchaeum sp.]